MKGSTVSKPSINATSPTEFALAQPAIRVAPSLLAADFCRLADSIASVEGAGAEVLHLDVMDGHFVPNISYGPSIIAQVRSRTSMFFDAHLMISDPMKYIPAFADAGCDLITFHIETSEEPLRVIEAIRQHGKAVGISINPTTEVSAIEEILAEVQLVLVMSVWPGFGGQKFMPEVLPKVERLRSLLRQNQRLEIDGGIGLNTAAEVVRAGADTLVAGTSVFGQADPGRAFGELTRLAEGVAKEGRA